MRKKSLDVCVVEDLTELEFIRDLKQLAVQMDSKRSPRRSNLGMLFLDKPGNMSKFQLALEQRGYKRGGGKTGEAIFFFGPTHTGVIFLDKIMYHVTFFPVRA